MPPFIKKLYKFFILILLISSCSENTVEVERFEPFSANIRMEVQILDSTYQLYSRPFTRIFFSTYSINKNGEKLNFEQSDTLSCRNGWGVKPLNYSINSNEDIIVLGAACETYMGPNYKEVIITFPEIERRIDSTGTANMVKTFAIYYN